MCEVPLLILRGNKQILLFYSKIFIEVSITYFHFTFYEAKLYNILGMYHIYWCIKFHDQLIRRFY